ncbi:MAG: acetyl-CoA carboxylase biotin carboxyl carrier protein [Romboutsia sp.]|uniref:acetyl-CoA carboxylase biotin carboxyl carrier protein n=1 Tax=Romboutsia sp. TaxID=1965302 RepID=UPI003F3D99D0
MNLNEIKELLKVIDQTKLTQVKLEGHDFKLEVSKINDHNVKISNADDAIDQSINKFDDKDVVNEVCADEIEETTNTSEIVAPLMGTFYSSPGPNESSFVKVGDIVKQGDTLCILEAMKLMNEINSDIDGEVVEILVRNEELVEYNQPLFKIKPL